MFKNIISYTMNSTLNITEEDLRKNLPVFKFEPCKSNEFSKVGFIPHIKGYDEIFYSANGQFLLTVYKEEKMLPTPVINQFLADKIEKFEENNNRKPKKAEKDRLKDEVIMDLLPKAFSKYAKTIIWIDTKNKLINVEAGSAKKAEDALAMLRKALGSLPVTPLTPEENPSIIMTEWVKSGVAPEGLLIGEEVELKSSIDNGIVTSKNQEIPNEEILKHIESNKFVSKLTFSFEKNTNFLLTEDLMFKRIKFTDVIQENIAKNLGEDPDAASKFDAEFCIYTEEVSKLILFIANTFNCKNVGQQ